MVLFSMARCAAKMALGGAFAAGALTTAGAVAIACVAKKAMDERKSRDTAITDPISG